jgi:hypothetical protein
MIYLVPIIIFVLSLAVDIFVETAAEISSDSLLDNDAGVAVQLVIITPDGVIDMRPEAAMPQRELRASSLRDAIGI